MVFRCIPGPTARTPQPWLGNGHVPWTNGSTTAIQQISVTALPVKAIGALRCTTKHHLPPIQGGLTVGSSNPFAHSGAKDECRHENWISVHFRCRAHWRHGRMSKLRDLNTGRFGQTVFERRNVKISRPGLRGSRNSPWTQGSEQRAETCSATTARKLREMKAEMIRQNQ